MRNNIRKQLRSLVGQELFNNFTKFAKRRKKYKTGIFSRDGISQKLESYLPHRDGYYVELGANDGAHESNSYYFELKKGWRGTLIEPSPKQFHSCALLRGKNNRVFCNACVPFDYSDKYVEMRYANAMTTSESLPSDIPDKEEFYQRSLKWMQPGELPFAFGAVAATLTSLLEKAEAPNLMDFLSLDVEGAESSVLDGLDHSRYRFKYMVIECRDINRLEAQLETAYYRLIEKVTHHDYLFENLK